MLEECAAHLKPDTRGEECTSQPKRFGLGICCISPASTDFTCIRNTHVDLAARVSGPSACNLPRVSGART